VAGKANHPSAEASEALERLSRLSLRELSMESLLQSLADLTKRVMPGDSEASVTLLIKDRPSTVVGTGPLAAELDEAQYERGDGPCLRTARSGVPTEIVDTRTESRWPDYARVAAQRGNLSSLAVPLLLAGEEQFAGSLNVYARSPHAFDEASRTVATGIAPYAAVAAGTVQAYRTARSMADNLQIALESRAVIEQAKGILMLLTTCSEQVAFDLLAHISSHTHRKVRDVAQSITDSASGVAKLPADVCAIIRDACPPSPPHP